jgi:hypothetical protein
LYTFSSDHSLAVVLTQKDEQGNEFPFSFMSIGLQGVELKLPNGGFSIHKAIK